MIDMTREVPYPGTISFGPFFRLDCLDGRARDGVPSSSVFSRASSCRIGWRGLEEIVRKVVVFCGGDSF